MKHILRAPLIGEVFDQVINKRKCRILWQHRPTGMLCLQSANDWGGIAVRCDLPTLLKEERGHEAGFGRLDPESLAHRLGLTPSDGIRDASVAQ